MTFSSRAPCSATEAEGMAFTPSPLPDATQGQTRCLSPQKLRTHSKVAPLAAAQYGHRHAPCHKYRRLRALPVRVAAQRSPAVGDQCRVVSGTGRLGSRTGACCPGKGGSMTSGGFSSGAGGTKGGADGGSKSGTGGGGVTPPVMQGDPPITGSRRKQAPSVWCRCWRQEMPWARAGAGHRRSVQPAGRVQRPGCG